MRLTPVSRNRQSAAATLKPGGSTVAGRLAWLVNRSPAFRRACLVAYWTCIFVLTHWPDIDDLPGADWLLRPGDTFAHFCAYAGWAAMWCWVLRARGTPIRGRVALGVLAGGAGYGVFDELTQTLVARDPAVSDFMADMAGVSFVLLLFGWWSSRPVRERTG